MRYLFIKATIIGKILILTVGLLWSQNIVAQELESYNNTITFYSEAPLENIEATSQKVYCSLNMETGEVNATVMIKSFEFDKQKMKEHFNEQYLESHKYPDANFKGRIADLEKLKTRANDTYKTVGKLTVHGVTNPINVMVNLRFDDEKVIGSSEFTVTTADYKIKIPRFFIKNIAEEIDVTVNFELQ